MHLDKRHVVVHSLWKPNPRDTSFKADVLAGLHPGRAGSSGERARKRRRGIGRAILEGAVLARRRWPSWRGYALTLKARRRPWTGSGSCSQVPCSGRKSFGGPGVLPLRYTEPTDPA